MAETPESLLNLVNASGFAFQLRVEKEINSVQSIYPNLRWSVSTREHRSIDALTGSENYIDLIVSSGRMRIAIECKRVADSSWVFLLPTPEYQTPRAMLLWTTRKPEGNVAEWDEVPMLPQSHEAMFCVVRGQSDKDTPMLERVSGSLLRSTESLANQELSTESKQNKPRVYVPMIITNAKLQTCHFEPSRVDIIRGQLERADATFNEVAMVRFRKNLSTAIASRKGYADLAQFNEGHERTVFIVNASRIAEVFGQFNLPRDGFGYDFPWDIG